MPTIADITTFQDREWERDTESLYDPDTGPIRVFYMRWFNRQFHDVPDLEAAVAFVGWMYDEIPVGDGEWTTFGAFEAAVDTRTGEDITHAIEARMYG